MALKRTRPATLPAVLTITGQGETEKLVITYNNVTQDVIDEAGDPEKGGSMAKVVLTMVKDWDAEFELTTSDLQEMEKLYPGVLMGVVMGWHEARRFQRVKN